MGKITEKLRNRILGEMILTKKEKDIQELIKLGKWTNEEIRKRWSELELKQKISKEIKDEK